MNTPNTSTTTKPRPQASHQEFPLLMNEKLLTLLKGRPYVVEKVTLHLSPYENRRERSYVWEATVSLTLTCTTHSGQGDDRCPWQRSCCPQNVMYDVNGYKVHTHTWAQRESVAYTARVLRAAFDKPSQMPLLPPAGEMDPDSKLVDRLLWQDILTRTQTTVEELVRLVVAADDERDAKEAARALEDRATAVAEHLRQVARKRAKAHVDFDARLKALREELMAAHVYEADKLLAEVLREGLKEKGTTETEPKPLPDAVVNAAVIKFKNNVMPTEPWAGED